MAFQRRSTKRWTKPWKNKAKKRFSWLAVTTVDECTFQVANPDPDDCPFSLDLNLVTDGEVRELFSDTATVVRVIGDFWARPRFSDTAQAAAAVIHTRWGAYKNTFNSALPNGFLPQPFFEADYEQTRWMYMRQRLTDVGAAGSVTDTVSTGTQFFDPQIAGCCAPIPGFVLDLGTGVQLPSACVPCAPAGFSSDINFTTTGTGGGAIAPRFQRYSMSSKRKMMLRENEGYSVAFSMSNLVPDGQPAAPINQVDISVGLRILVQIG